MKSSSAVFGTRTAQGSDRWDAPFTVATEESTLDLTTTDATVSLGPGVYACYAANATDETVVGLGVTTTARPPASGSPPGAGLFSMNVGMTGSFTLNATTTLHARVLSGTANLRLMRKL
jgi:hypothetical protein